MDKWLIDAAIEIQASKSIKDIKLALTNVRSQLNFDMFLYAVKLPRTFTRTANFIISEYPEKWIIRYANQGYSNIDPVVKHCLSSHTPYHWGNYKDYTDETTRNFMKEACEYDLCNGISVGMRGFDGENGIFSVAINEQKALSPENIFHATLSLNALLPYLHEKIRTILQEDEFSEAENTLTERERECLFWTAEGKTAKETAQILAISESTIVFHLKNTIKKLNVHNRNQAVAKAVLIGIIVPIYPSSTVTTYHF